MLDGSNTVRCALCHAPQGGLRYDWPVFHPQAEQPGLKGKKGGFNAVPVSEFLVLIPDFWNACPLRGEVFVPPFPPGCV